MKQRTFRVNLIENPFMIGWLGVDMVSSPPGNKLVDWKPEPSWVSKRLFVRRVLPDAYRVSGLFGKLAVVSYTFSDQVGGGSLTGWQENDTIQSIWERAYRNLTTGTFDSLYLRYRIKQEKDKMVEREKGRG